MITVRVSSGDEKQKTFSIHKDILSRCTRLRDLSEYETVELADTEPGIFELASSFLYTGGYRTHRSSGPKAKDKQSVAREFEIHSLLYCFAECYGLEELARSATASIETLEKVPYSEVLDIAKKVYPKLPKDDVWYRDYLKNATRDEMKDNKHLVQEPYVIDVVVEEKGRLASDLFLTMTQEALYQTASQVLPPASVSTPRISILGDSPCEQRNKHLTALKGNGPWKNCPKCSLERDRMMTTGRAIMSVVFADIWPTFCEQVGAVPDVEPQKGQKKARNKLRRALKEAVCHVPVDRVTHAILAQDGYEQCPEQSEHLKQREGKWLWESCSRCLNDRDSILRQLHDLGIGEGFPTLFGLAKASEPSVTHIQTALSPPDGQTVQSPGSAVMVDFEAARTPPDDVFTDDSWGASKNKKDVKEKEKYVEEEKLPEVASAAGSENSSEIPKESVQEARMYEEWGAFTSKSKKSKKAKKNASPVEVAPEELHNDEADPAINPLPEALPKAAEEIPADAPADCQTDLPPAPDLDALGSPESQISRDNHEWGGGWNFGWTGLGGVTERGTKKEIEVSRFPESDLKAAGFRKLPSWKYRASSADRLAPNVEAAYPAKPEPSAVDLVTGPKICGETPMTDRHMPERAQELTEEPAVEDCLPPDDEPEMEGQAEEPREGTENCSLCPRRRSHLKKEARWIKCDVCRNELATYAKKLVRTVL